MRACLLGNRGNRCGRAMMNLAYIDPGSGTLLLQFLFAGIVGSGVFFRNQLIGLASWIRQRTFARKT
jgi:hypothetical protein